jgi:hypothetical protein
MPTRVKNFVTALYFNGSDGLERMLRATQNVNGKIMKRDVCTFNSFGDIRTCYNWDTNVTTKEMKNLKGEWYFVE